MRRICVAVAIVLGLLLTGTAWAQSGDQVPLGEVAKQKPTKKAKRVITEDEIPPRPQTVSSPAALGVSGSTASQSEAEQTGAGTLSGSSTEANSGNAALEKKIARLKDSEAAEQRIVQKFEDALNDSTLSEFRRNTYEETLKQAKDTLAGFQNQRQTLERQLAEQKQKQQESPKSDETSTP